MQDEIVMVVTHMEAKRIRVPKEARERRDRLVSEGRCVGCEQEITGTMRVTRGLCATCYVTAMNHIRKGKITEAELMRQGYLLRPKKGGRKPTNKFTKQLAEQ